MNWLEVLCRPELLLVRPSDVLLHASFTSFHVRFVLLSFFLFFILAVPMRRWRGLHSDIDP